MGAAAGSSKVIWTSRPRGAILAFKLLCRDSTGRSSGVEAMKIPANTY